MSVFSVAPRSTDAGLALPPLTTARAGALFLDDRGAATAEYAIATIVRPLAPTGVSAGAPAVLLVRHDSESCRLKRAPKLPAANVRRVTQGQSSPRTRVRPGRGPPRLRKKQ